MSKVHGSQIRRCLREPRRVQSSHGVAGRGSGGCPKHYNFRNKMNFTRRLGNRGSQAKERPYRCESGKSQHTASSELLEFRTHDKVWREHPGQIMEGAGDRATGQRGASGKMRWWEAVTSKVAGRAPGERRALACSHGVWQPAGSTWGGGAAGGRHPDAAGHGGADNSRDTTPHPVPRNLRHAWHRAWLRAHSLRQA